MKSLPCPYCGGLARLGYRTHGRRFRENKVECQCGQFAANIDKRCLVLNWFGQPAAIYQTPIVVRDEDAMDNVQRVLISEPGEDGVLSRSWVRIYTMAGWENVSMPYLCILVCKEQPV